MWFLKLNLVVSKWQEDREVKNKRVVPQTFWTTVPLMREKDFCISVFQVPAWSLLPLKCSVRSWNCLGAGLGKKQKGGGKAEISHCLCPIETSLPIHWTQNESLSWRSSYPYPVHIAMIYFALKTSNGGRKIINGKSSYNSYLWRFPHMNIFYTGLYLALLV